MRKKFKSDECFQEAKLSYNSLCVPLSSGVSVVTSPLSLSSGSPDTIKLTPNIIATVIAKHLFILHRSFQQSRNSRLDFFAISR